MTGVSYRHLLQLFWEFIPNNICIILKLLSTMESSGLMQWNHNECAPSTSLAPDAAGFPNELLLFNPYAAGG